MKPLKLLPLLVFIWLIMNTGVLQANSEADAKGTMHDNDHAIGFSAGTTAGVGLSYRYWHGVSGVQVTALPIIGEEERYVSLGISHLYMIRAHSQLSLYLSTSASLFHEYYTTHDFTGQVTDEVNETAINLGVGPAMDVQVADIFSVNFVVGLGAYDVFDGIRTNLTVEIGSYYWF